MFPVIRSSEKQHDINYRENQRYYSLDDKYQGLLVFCDFVLNKFVNEIFSYKQPCEYNEQLEGSCKIEIKFMDIE
jgi:hypothetical protein